MLDLATETLRTAKHFRVPPKLVPGIPSERAVQMRLKRWLKYLADKTSQKDIADATGMSQAHVSNLVDLAKEDRRPGLDALIRMHYGLDVTLRELVHEEPPSATRAPPASRTDAVEEIAHTPKVRRARK